LELELRQPMLMVPNQSTGLMSVTAMYSVSAALSSMLGCCVLERLTDTLARIVRRAFVPITICSTMESVMLVVSDVPAMAMRVVASTDCMRTRLAPLREMSPCALSSICVPLMEVGRPVPWREMA